VSSDCAAGPARDSIIPQQDAWREHQSSTIAGLSPERALIPICAFGASTDTRSRRTQPHQTAAATRIAPERAESAR